MPIANYGYSNFKYFILGTYNFFGKTKFENVNRQLSYVIGYINIWLITFGPDL